MKTALGIQDSKDRYPTPATLGQTLSQGLWTPARHLVYVSNKIAEIQYRPLRLIVTFPPRHGKSELISHWTPVWFLSHFPRLKVMLSSYEANFAASWGRRVRNTIAANQSELGICIAGDSGAAATWETELFPKEENLKHPYLERGGMNTAGVGGPITGKGANLFIIDDPVKNIAEAESLTYREAAWDWWRTTARTRLQPGASMIIIMTRWHDDDLVGRLLKENDENWEIINLPAIAESNDALGRQIGEPLWPEKYNREALAILEKIEGPRYWPALFQQRPVAEGGNIFKMEWWNEHFYTKQPQLLTIGQYWDTAFKKNATSDYSVCVTAGRTVDGIVILDVWRDRVEFPELVVMAKAKYAQYRPNRVKVEDAASGQSLIQALTRDTKLPIVEQTPEDSQFSSYPKEVRAKLITAIVAGGHVQLPAEASWLATFLSELSRFPAGEHDDIVDAFVYAVNDLWRTPGAIDEEPPATPTQLEFGGIGEKWF